jgi:hypothetical protein
MVAQKACLNPAIIAEVKVFALAAARPLREDSSQGFLMAAMLRSGEVGDDRAAIEPEEEHGCQQDQAAAKHGSL